MPYCHLLSLKERELVKFNPDYVPELVMERQKTLLVMQKEVFLAND